MLVIELPGCTYVTVVTLSDTADNIRDAAHIQNVGTAGKVMIRQDGGYGNVDIYLGAGQAIQCLRHWHGAMTTGAGTGAGVDLRAFR